MHAMQALRSALRKSVLYFSMHLAAAEPCMYPCAHLSASHWEKGLDGDGAIVFFGKHYQRMHCPPVPHAARTPAERQLP
jgi:hypothetical protein